MPRCRDRQTTRTCVNHVAGMTTLAAKRCSTVSRSGPDRNPGRPGRRPAKDRRRPTATGHGGEDDRAKGELRGSAAPRTSFLAKPETTASAADRATTSSAYSPPIASPAGERGDQPRCRGGPSDRTRFDPYAPLAGTERALAVAGDPGRCRAAHPVGACALIRWRRFHRSSPQLCDRIPQCNATNAIASCGPIASWARASRLRNGL